MTATPPPVNLPPTAFAPGDDVERSTWPTVVGIVCIVFGGFGMLAMCVGGATSIFLPDVFRQMEDPTGQLKATADAMEQYRVMNLTLVVVMLAVAILLLVGGIYCLRRRMKARVMLMTWAVLKVVFVVVAAIANTPVQRAQLEAQSAAGGGPQAVGAPFGSAFTAITSGCNIVWGWLLPAFILIWFSRRAVRDEVENWPHE